MKHFALAACAALMAGCAATPPSEPVPAVAAVDPTNPLFAPGYLAMAASSDQFEIQSGQLAGQMSQNQAVRSFGNLLVAHHTSTTNQLMAAAQAAGLTPPPPALMPNHQAMLDQLRAAGPNFDVAFRDIQVQAHQDALTLHQGYANGGDLPALRTVAAAAVPIIQQHLSAAQALNVMAAPPLPAPAAPAEPRTGERG